MQAGLGEADKALALKPDYFEALTYKNLLLRSEALLEKDPAKQQQLIKQADQLRDKAQELQKAKQAARGHARQRANPAPPPRRHFCHISGPFRTIRDGPFHVQFSPLREPDPVTRPFRTVVRLQPLPSRAEIVFLG